MLSLSLHNHRTDLVCWCVVALSYRVDSVQETAMKDKNWFSFSSNTFLCYPEKLNVKKKKRSHLHIKLMRIFTENINSSFKEMVNPLTITDTWRRQPCLLHGPGKGSFLTQEGRPAQLGYFSPPYQEWLHKVVIVEVRQPAVAISSLQRACAAAAAVAAAAAAAGPGCSSACGLGTLSWGCDGHMVLRPLGRCEGGV